ncbi:hypothetical protein PSQ19_05135 [Devosia algicola]|uniref:Amidohydrolase-related domain-containing protein n=1 Tax=Devosia algicola TaxID=3026418 RepID=A0ABY7YQ83_9HYPH|nr:hypothetical protein [Devosia algicola]WDR03486.1 hypothetical protein PSQ19_05135 [Devosia algicola]
MTIGAEREAFLADLPIVDAHHHYWQLGGRLAYPWLETEPWLRFRYGDYAAIRRDYLPADYRRDAGTHNIVADVHMEAEVAAGSGPAEIDWLDETRGGYPFGCGCPNLVGSTRYRRTACRAAKAEAGAGSPAKAGKLQPWGRDAWCAGVNG